MTRADVYLRNLALWARGIRWLWTRNAGRLHLMPHPRTGEAGGVWVTAGGRVYQFGEVISYKPGFGPWRFLPLYLTTYLAGTLAGYGVVSLSRAWDDRSEWTHPDGRKLHPFATFMTRLLDWGFPGSAHGRHTGPRLWGSVNLREP